MNYFNNSEAKAFADKWLPFWTGNRPRALADFYSDDAFYSDPSIPDGVVGRESIYQYFRVLLANNPCWVWHHTGSIPMQDGFVNQWRANIPVGDKVLLVDGVCLVQIRDKKIYRNSVHFDRSELLIAIQHHRSLKKPT